jgi:peptidyl-prolyl cis-trans isomerase C
LKKSLVIVAIVFAIAGVTLFAQWKFSSVGGMTVTKDDMKKILEALPPQVIAQIGNDQKSKDAFSKQFAHSLALTLEAEQRGLAQQADLRNEIELQYAIFLGGVWRQTVQKDPKTAGQGDIKNEDVEQFYKQKPTAFDDFLAKNPRFKGQKNLDAIKAEYGKLMVAKSRAEASGLAKENYVQALWKAQQANILGAKLLEDLQGKSDISDAEISASYEAHKSEYAEMKASHILISTMPKAEPPAEEPPADPKDPKKAKAAKPKEAPKTLTKEEAKKKALEVLQKVQAGGDFAKLAEEFSDDPGSAKQGGDLGYFRDGQMVPPFETAAKALKPGEVTTDPVETQFGYHIIKMIEKRVAPLDDPMKAEIRNKLRQERIDKKLDDLVARLRIKVANDFTVPNGLAAGQ